MVNKAGRIAGPFIGRARELGIVQAAVQEALAGHGRRPRAAQAPHRHGPGLAGAQRGQAGAQGAAAGGQGGAPEQ